MSMLNRRQILIVNRLQPHYSLSTRILLTAERDGETQAEFFGAQCCESRQVCDCRCSLESSRTLCFSQRPDEVAGFVRGGFFAI